MENSIGERISDNNWSQCCIVQNKELQRIVELPLGTPTAFLVVISQSCDLVHPTLEDEPYVECIECHPIEKEDGNFTHGKNPRRLHLSISNGVGGRDQAVEILPYQIHRFDRVIMEGIFPSKEYYLSEIACRILTLWLAARYVRAAFPDEFNNRINRVKKKLKKKASLLVESVTGIYIQILPDREIAEEDVYSVNLLALVSVSFGGELAAVESTISEYASLMQDQCMEVQFKVLKENVVSVSTIRSYRQLDWDHISLRSNPPAELPSDV